MKSSCIGCGLAVISIVSMDLSVKHIQDQIDLLTAQKDELLFEERHEINKKSYKYISGILDRWCKESILDHHQVILIDKISEKHNFYSERQIDEGVGTNVEEQYRKRSSIDKVFDNGNFKILIKDAKLKRPQREAIRETIQQFIETGEYVYYEF